jgi:hypothetical protein
MRLMKYLMNFQVLSRCGSNIFPGKCCDEVSEGLGGRYILAEMEMGDD